MPPSSGDTDAEGAVQLDLLLATEGSPEYPSVAAQLKLTALLGGLRVHLASESLSAVGELIVRTRGLVDRAAAAVARSAESPRTPKPAPSVATAPGAVSGASAEPRASAPAVATEGTVMGAVSGASAPAVASGLSDEKPLWSRDDARDDATLAAPAAEVEVASAAAHAASAAASAKPVLAIEAYVGYLYVVLHEEAALHAYAHHGAHLPTGTWFSMRSPRRTLRGSARWAPRWAPPSPAWLTLSSRSSRRR